MLLHRHRTRKSHPSEYPSQLSTRRDEDDFDALVSGGSTRAIGRHDWRRVSGRARLDAGSSGGLQSLDHLSAYTVVLRSGASVVGDDQDRKRAVRLGDATELGQFFVGFGTEFASFAYGPQRDHHPSIVSKWEKVGAAELAEQRIGFTLGWILLRAGTPRQGELAQAIGAQGRGVVDRCWARAVQLAAPFRLPPEFYDAWKVIKPAFDKRLG